MATAFQADAFQNNAFQIDAGGGGGGARRIQRTKFWHRNIWLLILSALWRTI